MRKHRNRSVVPPRSRSAAARQKVNRCLVGCKLLAVHVDAVNFAGAVGCLHEAKFVLPRLARNHNAVATVRIGLALIEQLSVLAAIQQDSRIFNALPLLVIGVTADARQVLRVHDGLVGVVGRIQHDRFPLVEGAPHIRIFVLIEENRVGGPGLPEPLGLRRIGRAVPLKAAVPHRAPGEQGIASEEEALARLIRHRVARDIVVDEVAVNKARHAVRVIVVLRDLKPSADQIFDCDYLIRNPVVRVDVDRVIDEISRVRIDELLLLEAAEVLIHITRAVLIALEGVEDIRVPAFPGVPHSHTVLNLIDRNALSRSRFAV